MNDLDLYEAATVNDLVRLPIKFLVGLPLLCMICVFVALSSKTSSSREGQRNSFAAADGVHITNTHPQHPLAGRVVKEYERQLSTSANGTAISGAVVALFEHFFCNDGETQALERIRMRLARNRHVRDISVERNYVTFTMHGSQPWGVLLYSVEPACSE